MNVVVAGIGNAYRSDDGAGLEVAARVRELGAGAIRVQICEQEPSRLVDAWDGADVAFVVDAVASGEPAGTVHRFDAATELPTTIFGASSTHALGVADAVELARALGRLPARTIVYGIEGKTFTAGHELTPAVARAVDAVAHRILEEVEACTSRP
jgi:hydrogenase maturation protease